MLGCGTAEPESAGPAIDPETLARIEEAYEHLNAKAHRLVIREVLKTCDKWRHIDKPCVDEEVRIAQLECWLEAGAPVGERMWRANRRQWVTNTSIMRMQNLCMANRRWRKVKGGPDF